MKIRDQFCFFVVLVSQKISKDPGVFLRFRPHRAWVGKTIGYHLKYVVEVKSGHDRKIENV